MNFFLVYISGVMSGGIFIFILTRLATQNVIEEHAEMLDEISRLQEKVRSLEMPNHRDPRA